MSDSDDELLSNNIFNFPNDGSTIISAKGPDTNVNLTLPRTLGPPRYAESNYERQRHKRDISPMSVASACDARFRSFNNSYYPRAMSSQRSAYHCRSGSPMSTRTCDTNTTVTAADIVEALNNPNFNRMDTIKIKKAINKWRAIDRRKRIEKRQKRRMFLERYKRTSYDSGDQASLSSSSDDNRSTKTTGYRKKMSSCRSTKTNISDFGRTIQESYINKDCTENFRQNYSRNFLSRPASNSTFMPARNMNTYKHFQEPRNNRVFVFGNKLNFQTQRERFQNGFSLPSQRFNKSIASSTIQETQRHHVEETDSDDNIFSVNNNDDKANRKRCINEENAVLRDNKRPRVISPCKNSTEARRAKEIDNAKALTESNNFVFAKPSLPIRKTVKEKPLSQTAPLIPDIVVSEETETQTINKENTTKDKEEIPHNITQSTDLSMRTATRRKLYTQKVDIAENKNVSSENLAQNSPQGSIYSAKQNEKHKARKLVTNQSCLSREIEDDNNSILALIQKIVPPNSLNVTTQFNKTEVQSTKNKSNNSNDKWDVSSIISMKDNDDDCSDTFTDEDILNGDINNTVKEVPSENETKSSAQNNNKKTMNLNKMPSKDKLIVSEKVTSKDKIPIHFFQAPISKQVAGKDKLSISDKAPPVFRKPDPVSVLKNHEKTLCKVIVEKMPTKTVNGVKNYIKSFWDTTDSESDAECLTAKRNHFRENNNEFTKPQEKVAPHHVGEAAILKKSTATVDSSIMSTAETTQTFNATSFKIRSHRSLKSKKCCDENKENSIKSYFDPLNKKQQSKELIQTDNQKMDDKIVTNKNNIDTTKKQREKKPTMTKVLRTPPKAKQNKTNIEVENTDQATKQKELTKNQEPAKAQTKNQEPAKAQTKNQELAKAQTKNQELAKAQPKKQESAKAQTKNQEPAKAQPKKQESVKAQPKKQESVKAQPKKQESVKAQSKKQDSVKVPSKKQEITKITDKQPQNKKNTTTKKSETAKDPKTSSKTKPKENEAPKTRGTSKNTRYQKLLLEISSLTNSMFENDISTISRPIRTCRLKSAESSSSSLNMTLRPKKTSSKVKCINLSTPSMRERAI